MNTRTEVTIDFFIFDILIMKDIYNSKFEINNALIKFIVKNKRLIIDPLKTP